MRKPIYLDHAATTPVSNEVLSAMLPFLKDKFYNPSATYLLARDVKKDLEEARSKVAYLLGVNSSTVNFVAGGSEANNLAIHGIMRQFPDSNAITSNLEHDSIAQPLANYNFKLADVRQDGIINLDSVLGLIDDKTVLITLMIANNEVGTVQPIKELSFLIEEVRKKRRINNNQLPIYILADGCQAGNFIDLHINNLKVDLLSLNGSKIYGPKQSGVLYVKPGVKLKPLIEGGGQEHNLRSGTENVAFAVAFSKALEQAQQSRKDEVNRLRTIQSHFIGKLQEALPQIMINGSLKHRLPNNVHITIPGVDNERMLFLLDDAGIMASAGSACSASSNKPSKVLSAMGIDDQLIQSSIRLTMGRETTILDMDYVVETIQKILK